MFRHTLDPDRECTVKDEEGLKLINQLLEIYDQGFIAKTLNDLGFDSWCRESINRWVKGKADRKLSHREFEHLKSLLPKPFQEKGHEFRFVDPFAVIGRIRRGVEIRRAAVRARAS